MRATPFVVRMSDLLNKHYIGEGIARGQVWGCCVRCRGLWAYKPAGALGRMLGFDIDPLLVCRCGDSS